MFWRTFGPCSFNLVFLQLLFTAGLSSPTSRAPEFIASGSPTLKFWHLTDIHLNPEYNETGDPETFCRFVRPHQSNAVAGPYGVEGTRSCDSPFLLVEYVIQHMKSIAEGPPDFILWTGDGGPHWPDEMLRNEYVMEILRNLTTLVKATFHGVPFYASFGNHDYSPNNQLPEDSNPVYEFAANIWGDFLDTEAVDQLRQHGYYRTTLLRNRKFVLLSLNMLLLYVKDKVVPMDREDPAGMLQFTEQTLAEARSSGKKVIIIGHVVPGSWDDRSGTLLPKHNRRLVNMFIEYSEVISGLYFGHLHRDVFSLLRKGDSDEFVQYYLAAPSLVPWVGTNPAVRWMEMDPDNGDLRRVRQHYMNLSLANHGYPSLQVEYDWSVPSSQWSLDFFVDFYNKIRADKNQFDRFYLQSYVLADNKPMCVDFCLERTMCAITEIDYTRFDQCEATAAAKFGEISADLKSTIQPTEGAASKTSTTMMNSSASLTIDGYTSSKTILVGLSLVWLMLELLEYHSYGCD